MLCLDPRRRRDSQYRQRGATRAWRLADGLPERSDASLNPGGCGCIAPGEGALSAEQNTTLVGRALEEVRNRQALDVVDVLFTPDYVNHGGLIAERNTHAEANAY